MNKAQRYGLNIATALDRLVNAIGGGSDEVTISSRLGMNYPNSWARKFVDWLFWTLFKQENHCARSLYNEQHEVFNEDAIIR